MDRAVTPGMWEEIRSDFPATRDVIYLNSAAVSPLSTRTRRALDGLSRAMEERGILALESVFERVAKIREGAAWLIGASPREIAFTGNTTSGILLAARGIRWKDGDNVVMPAVEFPANVYPWMSLRDRGVELRMVEPESGEVTAEMLADVCDSRTRAVTVSWVQFSTGYRVDLEELGDFCRNRSIYLHVDAIQGLGALAVDVRKLGIDFLSAGGHKWMLALPGAGIFYCREDLIEEIELSNPGWTGVAGRDDYLDYRFEYVDEATRFEAGSLNFHGIYALGESIDRIRETGREAFEDRVLELSGTLSSRLREAGFETAIEAARERTSGIVCFGHPAVEPERIFGALEDAGVVCALREGRIRLSPHVYNTTEECERVMSVLDGLSRR